MGLDSATAVVNPYGEVSGRDGLFVLDGADLFGAAGGNPSLTIAAVAEHCVESAIRPITGHAGWIAPQRGQAVQGAVPENIAIEWARWQQQPQPTARKGLTFHHAANLALSAGQPQIDPAIRDDPIREFREGVIVGLKDVPRIGGLRDK